MTLDRKVPLGPTLQDGAKGHNMKEKYLTGKPRPLGRELQFRERLEKEERCEGPIFLLD